MKPRDSDQVVAFQQDCVSSEELSEEVQHPCLGKALCDVDVEDVGIEEAMLFRRPSTKEVVARCAHHDEAPITDTGSVTLDRQTE